MRTYGQIQTAFWVNPEIKELSSEAKLLATYLLTSPHSNGIGCYYLPDGYVMEDLSWKHETVSKRYAELFQNGFMKRCEQSKYILIYKFIKWNPISSSNVAKAREREFLSVPKSSSVINELANELLEYGAFLSDGFKTVLKRYRNGIEMVSNSEPYRKEPEPEPEPEPEREKTKAKKKEPSHKFTPPIVEEVREHCQAKGYTFDPETFCAFYESKGWKVGKTTMKSWKAACVTWQKRQESASEKEVPPELRDWVGMET